MEPAEFAILKTVVYADLFDYPLRFEELCRGLFDVALAPDEVRHRLDHSPALAAVLDERDGFVFLVGREGLLAARCEGERRAKELLSRHRGVIARVARLPYVRLVALSGAAAFDNVHDDDLDLFVVARAGRAWSACMLVTLLSRAFGARRAICANYFLDESSLALADRDLYTAHQLVHLRPLAGDDAHRALLGANAWVADLFPAAYATALETHTLPTRVGLLERLFAFGPGALFEAVSRRVLTANLRRKIPTGTDPASVRLGPGRLKLHINDHRPDAIARFEHALAAAVDAAERATLCEVASGSVRA
jgi:hypothetical protein